MRPYMTYLPPLSNKPLTSCDFDRNTEDLGMGFIFRWFNASVRNFVRGV